MSVVGIIANPSASKDIRRLVAQGRVVPDWEKVNILRRVLLGLQSVGVAEVVAMPDSSHLCQRAAADAQLSLNLSLLDMPAYYTEGDTVRAAALMKDLGVRCLITLGGDGTNRAAACGSSTIPLVPISTGTNNVFPAMTEGTLAGMAAGLVATGGIFSEWVTRHSKTLAVYVDGEYRDLALVDVALSKERFTATRAIWDLDTLYEVFLTRTEPAGLGLASVGARLESVTVNDPGGLHYILGRAPDGDSSADLDADPPTEPYPPAAAATVLAPIAPGVIPAIPIAHWNRLNEGVRVAIEPRHSAIALDGERAFTVTPEQQVEISVQRNGPPVVQVERTLRLASEQGLFRR